MNGPESVINSASQLTKKGTVPKVLQIKYLQALPGGWGVGGAAPRVFASILFAEFCSHLTKKGEACASLIYVNLRLTAATLIPGQNLLVVEAFEFALVLGLFVFQYLEELGSLFAHAFVLPARIEGVGFFFFLHGYKKGFLVGDFFGKRDVDHVIGNLQVFYLLEFHLLEVQRVQVLEHIPVALL